MESKGRIRRCAAGMLSIIMILVMVMGNVTFATDVGTEKEEVLVTQDDGQQAPEGELVIETDTLGRTQIEKETGNVPNGEVSQPIEDKVEIAVTQTEEKTDNTPAFYGEYKNDEVKISVSAPENVLPAGVQLVVQPIEKKEISEGMTAKETEAIQKVNEQYEAAKAQLEMEAGKTAGHVLKGALVYDISFLVDGVEIEPNGEVSVVFDFAQAVCPEGQYNEPGVAVHHFKEEAGQTVVEDITDTSSLVLVEGTSAVEQVNFMADSFSQYAVTWSGRAGDTTPGKTNLTAAKVWKDKGKYENLIPESVTVTLKQLDGTPAYYENGELVADHTVQLSDSNEWKYRWENLRPGVRYIIEEAPIEGFKEPVITYSDKVQVLNVLEDKITSGSSTWDLGPNNFIVVKKGGTYILWTPIDTGWTPEEQMEVFTQVCNGYKLSGAKPQDFTYEFGAGSTAMDGVSFSMIEDTLNWRLTFADTSNWSLFWQGFYKSEITGTVVNELDFEAKTSITVNKNWIGDDEATRPKTIEIQLYQDDAAYRDPVVISGEPWSYTFENLPVYKEVDGKYVKCVYTVKETKVGADIVSDGKGGDYIVIVSSVEKDEETGKNTVTITNAMGKGRLEITKTIDKADFFDGDPIFTFKISNRDGSIVLYRTIRFTDNKQFTHTIIIDDLPAGEYVVEELDTVRYTCVSKNPQIVKVVNDKDLPDDAEFPYFYNKLTNEDNFSHTDVVENGFSIADNGTVTVDKNLVHGEDVPGAAKVRLVEKLPDMIESKMNRIFGEAEKEAE